MIGIGKKKAPTDAVDRLVDCHERIRRFSAMAVRLAESTDAPDEQIVEAAEAVRRYFSEALPRHVLDEDESIAPRLRGLDAALDRELDAMSREHGEHESALAELVVRCTAIAADPHSLGEQRGALSAVAEQLSRAFVDHLKREEEIIFPAVRSRLDAEAQNTIVAEMAARRG